MQGMAATRPQPMRAMLKAMEGRLLSKTQASHSLSWTSFLLRYAPDNGPCPTLHTIKTVYIGTTPLYNLSMVAFSGYCRLHS